MILVEAKMQSGELKLGFPNPVGWLAYLWQDTMFVKRAEYILGAQYFDRRSSSECYCNPKLLELETFGSRIILKPGKTVTHMDTWQLYDRVDFTPSEGFFEQIYHRLLKHKLHEDHQARTTITKEPACVTF